jgi:hypothetical protein
MKPGLRSAVSAMISSSNRAVPAVVAPIPIRSITGPCRSEPAGYATPRATRKKLSTRPRNASGAWSWTTVDSPDSTPM